MARADVVNVHEENGVIEAYYVVNEGTQEAPERVEYRAEVRRKKDDGTDRTDAEVQEEIRQAIRAKRIEDGRARDRRSIKDRIANRLDV